MMNRVVDYAVVVVYMVSMLGAGIWFSRKPESTEEYLLGGRTLPWWAVGIGFVMGLFSTYSIVMVPGEIFNHGLSLWIFSLLAPLFTILSFFIFIRFYFILKSFTPFAYLEHRYNKNVRTVVAMIYGWSRLLYLAMVLFATSKIFEGACGWHPVLSILLTSFVGIFYTFLGGRKAVIWTDVIQFVVLVCGLGAAIVVLCWNIDGGFFTAIRCALEQGHGLSLFQESSFYEFDVSNRLCFWILLFNAIVGPMFSCCADQMSVQTLLCNRSYEAARKSIFLNPVLSIPFTLILWFIGLGIVSYYYQHPDPGIQNGDTAFFIFMSSKVPSPFFGLMISAMLAAAMSTINAGLNSMSTIYLKEFHLRLFRPELDEAGQVAVSRLCTVCVGIFTALLASLIAVFSERFRQSVVEVQVVFDAFSVVILPVFLLAVLTRKASPGIAWPFCFLCWGMNMGGIYWYTAALSGLVENRQELMPQLAAGLILTATALAAAWLLRKSGWRKFFLYGGLGIAGFSCQLLFWFWRLCVGCEAGLGFSWVGIMGQLTFLAGGFVITLLFGRNAPPEKSEGFTIWSCRRRS
ncbi:hypothetical protein [uncultured Victivallis sp.]|uniref:sodium:solute symporter family protein n=1 Tax=uncultured Victivallis sp. TaxID=354118 RepID=UPI0025F3C5FD|nr:hypothetical protein [uncultured Victivallis sp.]